MKTDLANPVYSILNSPAVIAALSARSEPERISDRLEDPVSNAPLAFNSQGELSASSLVPRGEGPSNSEVGSQYTDTPVIDRDLSLVTGEHSEGKPALAFSTPTGISLGGSSEPLTLSPDHKPLGDPVTVRKSSAIRESSSSFAGTLFSKGSEKIKAASAFRSALCLLVIKSEVTFGRGESQ
ncbi:hypothetical protein L1987_88359 [Smallanthus sonchifolius]|nr:hypothetical protein L1987_88359 [Smallanthus sonchifolius]